MEKRSLQSCGHCVVSTVHTTNAQHGPGTRQRAIQEVATWPRRDMSHITALLLSVLSWEQSVFPINAMPSSITGQLRWWMSNIWLLQIRIPFGFLHLFPKVFRRQGPVADTDMRYRYIGIPFTISPPPALYPPQIPIFDFSRPSLRLSWVDCLWATTTPLPALAESWQWLWNRTV